VGIKIRVFVLETNSRV